MGMSQGASKVANARSAVPQAVPPRAGEQSADRINDFDHVLQAAVVEAFGGFSPLSMWRAWTDWAAHLAVSPGRRTELALSALKGGPPPAVDPLRQTRAPDKRFRDPAWRQWPYSLWAANFQAVERWWDEATRNIHGADPHDVALVNFIGRQALDAVAPTNFLLTNPVALARTRAEMGANLVRGASNFWRDFVAARRGERPQAALLWRPGETVALTKGAVVKRTHLAEIIQYQPTTDVVRPEPVVIAPAWIMKYYILDLQPENSLIKALTEAGFTVFAISWRNPTGADRDIGFDDYYTDGVRPALAAALAITGASRAHLVGYCIGGALAAVAASAMARDLDDRLQSLTLLAAQVDYTEAGELRLFIDHSQIAAIEDLMWEKGVFEGSRMAGAFHLLRSNDLVWSKLIHHYLMGEPEKMDAITAWSTDTTRMPYRMHRDYLKSFYLYDEFAEGRLKVEGRLATPRDIRLPVFALGTETDHVAPWRSVFKIHQLADADVTFALTNRGHNQGVISAPGLPDRHFRILTTRHDEARPDPDEWLSRAPLREGSWWPAWFDWLGAHSGAPVPPPPLGAPDYPPLAEAPGRYVRE
jgi:polyhydroxyalkanoate synthase